MKIFFFTKGDTHVASSRYRAFLIGEELHYRYGLACYFFSVRAPIPYAILMKRICKEDVIFLQRTTFASKIFFLFLLFIKIFKRTKIIFDFDDFQSFYGKKRLNVFIKLSDTVITSNTFLYDYTKRLHPSVAIVPTVVPFALYQSHRIHDYTRAGPITIGWVGDGNAHRENLLLLKPVLNKLFDKGIDFNFKIVGSLHNPLLTEAFSFLHERLLLIPTLAWSDMATTAATITTFDIGVMPLIDNPWNRGKSAFKAIEYMACGVPTVISAVGENMRLVNDGKNGFLARDEHEWIEKITMLVLDGSLRQRLGLAGAETVRARYSINTVIDQYHALIIAPVAHTKTNFR